VEPEDEFFDGQDEVRVGGSRAGNAAGAGQAAADLGHGGYLKVEAGAGHAKRYVWGLGLGFVRL